MPMKRAGYRPGWRGRRSRRRLPRLQCGPRALLSWMPGQSARGTRGLKNRGAACCPGIPCTGDLRRPRCRRRWGPGMPSLPRGQGVVWLFLNCAAIIRSTSAFTPVFSSTSSGVKAETREARPAAALERKGRSCKRRRSSPKATQDSPPTGTATQ